MKRVILPHWEKKVVWVGVRLITMSPVMIADIINMQRDIKSSNGEKPATDQYELQPYKTNLTS